MNSNYKLALSLVFCFLLIVLSSSLRAQSFKKGYLVLGLSEGSTKANFSSGEVSEKNCGFKNSRHAVLKGLRDPLTLEYGISDHLGIGLSLGNDIFTVDPAHFYGFTLPSQKPVEVFTSECLLDVNYHFFANKRFDLSAYTSIGTFSVYFEGSENIQIAGETVENREFSYNYKAKGSMIRMGAKAKYYVWKRFGVMSMLSVYSGSCSPIGVKGNTVASNVSTKVSGVALEGGICFRFF